MNNHFLVDLISYVRNMVSTVVLLSDVDTKQNTQIIITDVQGQKITSPLARG
jgi:hypothetical protein